MSEKALHYTERVAAVVAAIIFLQTLFYKFTAHPDSVHIFTVIGGEPYTRIGLGIVELIVAILLIYPKTSLYGGVLGLIITLGAIGSHFLKLGISVNNDGGILFALAITTFICCVAVVVIKKRRFPNTEEV